MSKSSRYHSDKLSLTIGFSLRGYLGLTYLNSEGEIVYITEEEFANFVPIIAAAFPNGFTIFDSKGGYYDTILQKTVIEPSKVLEIVINEKCSKKSIISFANLMDSYTIMFKQSGVFWTKNSCEFFSR